MVEAPNEIEFYEVWVDGIENEPCTEGKEKTPNNIAEVVLCTYLYTRDIREHVGNAVDDEHDNCERDRDANAELKESVEVTAEVGGLAYEGKIFDDEVVVWDRCGERF